MREIPLNHGRVALVDDSDYDYLIQWNWTGGMGKNGKFYARRGVMFPGNKNPKTIWMSRVIMGVEDPRIFVDHISGDTLDNRKENLRIVNNQQNSFNKGPNKNNTSGYKGVGWAKDKRKWKATICKDSKDIHLGFYPTIEEAANAYNNAAKEHFGEHAWLNTV